MSSARITWARAGEATVLTFDEPRSSVLQAAPAAPGTPLEGKLLTRGEPMTFQLKVASCKRRPDGLFVVEGRVVNLTRALRDELMAQLGKAPAAGDTG